MKNTNKKSGFTLVELAIVLVIIGLIVGGVLAGQDLIKAAEQRAAIGQIEKLDTAANAFRGKYNGIPGDITSPANFGFVLTKVTAGISANGNGVVNSDAVAGGRMSGEAAAFFSHLASASLVNESFTLTGGITDTTEGSIITTSPSYYTPISKLGKGVYMMVLADTGTNYYMMDNYTTPATGIIAYGHNMAPIIAYNIDNKLDDSNPSTGKVVAALTVAALANSTGTMSNAAITPGVCVDTGSTAAGDVYQTSSAAIGDASGTTTCTLRIKASF